MEIVGIIMCTRVTGVCEGDDGDCGITARMTGGDGDRVMEGMIEMIVRMTRITGANSDVDDDE